MVMMKQFSFLAGRCAERMGCPLFKFGFGHVRWKFRFGDTA
jgi:hypothetical protein